MKKIKGGLVVPAIVILTALFPVNIFAQSNLPEWLSKPPVERGAIYGIGHARLADSKKASTLAEEKAIVSAVYMASFLAIETAEEAFGPGEGESNGDSLDFAVDEAVRTISLSWAAFDIEIVKREQTSDGTWWCLAVYRKRPDISEGAIREFEKLIQ